MADPRKLPSPPVALDRRRFLATAGAFALSGLLPAPARAAGITLGAIRWDAWYGPVGANVRAVMEHVLSPDRWQDRAPACSTTQADRISFAPCAEQAQIDFEIELAEGAAIDYWAFCWYGEDSPLQNAWRLYRRSRLRTSLRWCAIIGSRRFVEEDPTDLPGFVRMLGTPDHATVLGGRPLLYVFFDGTDAAAVRETTARLRSLARRSGLSDPYIVLLIWSLAPATEAYGVDAVGIYSKPGRAPIEGDYDDLTRSVEAYWRRLARTGQPVVPTAVTGADRRPRVERPVPWEPPPRDASEIQRFYQEGTPEEIVAHIRRMIRWIGQNPAACPARTGLIYSWNEHDEGGSTLNPSLGDGDALVRALRPQP